MSWEVFLDPPWGPCEMCIHGCTKNIGVKDRVCIECDYTDEDEIMNIKCDECKAGTWHSKGTCLRCGTYTESRKSFL